MRFLQYIGHRKKKEKKLKNLKKTKQAKNLEIVHVLSFFLLIPIYQITWLHLTRLVFHKNVEVNVSTCGSEEMHNVLMLNGPHHAHLTPHRHGIIVLDTHLYTNNNNSLIKHPRSSWLWLLQGETHQIRVTTNLTKVIIIIFNITSLITFHS